MIKAIIAIYILIFATNLLANEDFNKPTLRVGFLQYAPFMEYSKNRAHGIVIDHVEKTLGNHFKIKWLDILTARVPYSLKSNYIDIHIAYTKTAERALKFDFVKPSLTISSALCWKNGNAGKALNATSDIAAGSRIIAIRVSYIPKELELIRKRVKWYELDLVRDYVKKGTEALNKGRADYLFIPAYYNGIETDELRCVRFSEVNHIYYVIKKGNPLKEIITPHLRELDFKN